MKLKLPVRIILTTSREIFGGSGTNHALSEHMLELSGRSVLLVDDDVDQAWLVRQAIRRSACALNLNHVLDAPAAQRYLLGASVFADRVLFPLPALIVLDVHMPGTSGLELLQWIKAETNFCSIPVVMFSASESPHDRSEASRLGAERFMEKSNGLPSLIDFVEHLSNFVPVKKAEAFKTTAPSRPPAPT